MGFRIVDRKTIEGRREFEATHLKLLEQEAARWFSEKDERKAKVHAAFMDKVRRIKDKFTTPSAAETIARHVEEVIKGQPKQSASSQTPVDVATLLDLL